MRLRKKTGSKYWYAEFSISKGRSTGTRRRCSLSTGTSNKTLALQIAEKLRQDKLRELHGIAGATSHTLESLRDQYLEWLEIHRARRSVLRARIALRNVLNSLKAKYPYEITRKKLASYEKRRRGEAATSTVAVELALLKAFLRRAVKEGWLGRLPCEIEVPHVPSKRRLVFLTEGEVPVFLETLQTWAWWPAFILLNAGLRCEELMFLQWGDIDFEAGLLWIVNKPELDWTPKGQKERSVPLSPELMMELIERKKETGWVAEGSGGGQLKHSAFAREVASAGERAALGKRITPHVLRHSFASRLAMLGVPLPTVQGLLGHAAIGTTMVYVHVSEEHRRTAVNKLKITSTGQRKEPKVVKLRG
ncbi:tyrosine-type recombinase/integrase [bacterium]|nr:tyrosine-type recombinase/integrase [bacterium]